MKAFPHYCLFRVILALIVSLGLFSSLNAAIAYRAAASSTTGSSTNTTVTVDKPSGVISGDLMIAAWDIRTADGTLTAPSGWTLVRTIDDPTYQLRVYSKVAGGSEPGSYTWTYSIARLMSCGIVAFSGVNEATPFQAEDGNPETGNVAAHTTPTISTTGSTAWLVSIFGDRFDGNHTWTASGVTERVDVHTNSGTGDVSIAIYHSPSTVAEGNHSQTATASGASAYAAKAILALQPGGGADTTPPTVSLTAPAANATVSGTVAVSANASDNVGVVGVQFKLDNANLGSEDMASPYTINWNTTGATEGDHTLNAVARDAAGNTTTSIARTVTVDNSPTWSSSLLTDPTKNIIVPTVVNGGQDLYPSANDVYDARGKAWLYGYSPGAGYPLNIRAAPAGVGFTGAKFNSNVADTVTWEQIKASNPSIDGTGLWVDPAANDIIIEGCHFDHQFDGIRFAGTHFSTGVWQLRHSYFKYIRDDGVQNDNCLQGEISDCLFDGVFMFYSERPGSGSGGTCPSPTKVTTITNTLARLDSSMAYFHEGHTYGHGQLFKMGGNTGNVNCSNCIWVVEDISVNGAGSMSWPAGTYTNCILIWLGSGAWPGDALPSGVTLSTDASIWDDAKAEWLADHGWDAGTGKFDFELP